MKYKIRKVLYVFLILTAVLSFAIVDKSYAAYPEKMIRFIIPYSPGGSSDLTARMLAPELEKILGQTVVVENITGAGGWVGWNALMKSKPDGYTISEIALGYVTGYLNPELKRKENLDSVTLLVNHVTDYTAWAAKPDFPHKNMKDLLAYVKENPGKIKVATSGANTQHHRLILLFDKIGYKMTPVHSGGTADSLAMILGGHVDIASIGAGDVRKQMDAGALIPLGVFSKKRSAFLPDTPTLLENTGIDFEAFDTRGIAGPKNMDPVAVRVLNAAFEKVMTNPEWIKKMNTIGQEVNYVDNIHYPSYLKKIEKDIKKALNW